MFEIETEIHLTFILQLISLALLIYGFIKLNSKGKFVMADLTKLTADVAAEVTVDESAITLLQGLKAQLDAAGTDPVALAALSSSLETEEAKLAAAVVANTPAAPTT